MWFQNICCHEISSHIALVIFFFPFPFFFFTICTTYFMGLYDTFCFSQYYIKVNKMLVIRLFSWTTPHLLNVFQDPLETLRVKCEETEHCVHTKERLELCEARVSSRSSTEEDCTEELFDFLHARDHCVNTFFFSLPLYFFAICFSSHADTDVYILLCFAGITQAVPQRQMTSLPAFCYSQL